MKIYVRTIIAEITNRRQSTARCLLRKARFPDVKTLDEIDWTPLKAVSQPKLLELSSSQYIGKAEDVTLADTDWHWQNHAGDRARR